MKDRIQKILDKESLQPSRFAEIIGVQRSSISHILSGRNNPSFDMIQSILKSFPQINPDWLILGVGDIYRPTIQKSLFETKQDTKPSGNEKIKSELTDEEGNFKPSQNRLNEDEVEQVLVFFKNKTFTSYKPRQDKE